MNHLMNQVQPHFSRRHSRPCVNGDSQRIVRARRHQIERLVALAHIRADTHHFSPAYNSQALRKLSVESLPVYQVVIFLDAP